jgi:hypothetical protein
MIRRPVNPVVLFVIAGLAFAAAMIWAAVIGWFVFSAMTTEGTVTEMRAQRDKDGVGHAPAFVFKDESGVEHRVESRLYRRPAGFTVGQKVKVLYRKGEPGGATIDGFMELWFGPLMAGVMSLIALIIGGVNQFRRRQRSVAGLY